MAIIGSVIRSTALPPPSADRIARAGLSSQEKGLCRGIIALIVFAAALPATIPFRYRTRIQQIRFRLFIHFRACVSGKSRVNRQMRACIARRKCFNPSWAAIFLGD